MTVATRLPRTFESSDLEFVAAVADQIAVALTVPASTHERRGPTTSQGSPTGRSSSARSIGPSRAAQRHKRGWR